MPFWEERAMFIFWVVSSPTSWELGGFTTPKNVIHTTNILLDSKLKKQEQDDITERMRISHR